MTAPNDVAQHHPVIIADQARPKGDISGELPTRSPRSRDQCRSSTFHCVAFGLWMPVVEHDPWPKLTLVVSLEAIFLSDFVMIGQNRQSAFQQAKADHDFLEQEQELKINTALTRAIHVLTTEIHSRVAGSPD